MATINTDVNNVFEQEEEKYLDVDVMLNFIQKRLEQDGIIVDKDIIDLILTLEMEYMIENGFAETVMNNG